MLTVPDAVIEPRALQDARTALPIEAALRQSANAGPKLPSGAILMPGSANDPRRMRGYLR